MKRKTKKRKEEEGEKRKEIDVKSINKQAIKLFILHFFKPKTVIVSI